MSETVKLIIEIPKETYEYWKTHKDEYVLAEAIGKGVLLDSNSEKAEVQAYFAGQTYGWEEGRKALIEDIKAEIESLPTEKIARCRKAYIFASEFKVKVLEILNNIGRG